MKKKRNPSSENSDENEIFPVDGLGIPILVEVVSPGVEMENSEQTAAILQEEIETEAQPLQSGLEAVRNSTSGPPANLDLEQLTSHILSSVTAEINELLEPLIRSKIEIALQQYRDELLPAVNEERGGESRPD